MVKLILSKTTIFFLKACLPPALQIEGTGTPLSLRAPLTYCALLGAEGSRDALSRLSGLMAASPRLTSALDSHFPDHSFMSPSVSAGSPTRRRGCPRFTRDPEGWEGARGGCSAALPPSLPSLRLSLYKPMTVMKFCKNKSKLRAACSGSLPDGFMGLPRRTQPCCSRECGAQRSWWWKAPSPAVGCPARHPGVRLCYVFELF